MIFRRRSRPSTDLAVELRNVTNRVEAALARTPFPSIADLQNRKATDMDFDITKTSPVVDPRHSSRRATAAKIAAGILIGSVGTGATFLATGQSNDRTIRDATSSEPLYLLPTVLPKDMCLANGQSRSDYERRQAASNMQTPDAVKLTKDGIEISVFASQMMGPPPGGLTGETVDINGAKGLLSISGKQTMLSWSRGRTNILMSGSGASKEDLLRIARSVTLVFDENGARVADLDGTGYMTSREGQASSMPDGALGYLRCGSTYDEADAPNIGVSTATASLIDGGAFFGREETKETELQIQRNGKGVPAKRVAFVDGSSVGVTIIWTEAGRGVSVFARNVSDADLEATIAGLKRVDVAEFDALAKTAKPPRVPVAAMGPDGDLLEREGKETGTFSAGGVDYTLRTAPKGQQLCTVLEFRMGGAGVDCQTPSPKPALRMRMSGNGTTVALATATATVTKGVATMPDGSTIELPNFVDDRAPGARAFVFVQPTGDPVPTKIEFFDAAGKVVSAQ
jgi:hypothetical protein